MSKITHVFKRQSELLDMMSKSIVLRLKRAIGSKGSATLVVSGGKTPVELFKVLSQISLPWEQVTVGLSDERWIPVSNKESNEYLVKKYLLQDKAKKASFVGMFSDQIPLNEAEVICSDKTERALLPFDIILLGMGSDGHTASLFPENIRLDEAFDLNSDLNCIMMEPSKAPYTRMSLTRRAILSASYIYLYFEGQEKQDVFHQVMSGDDTYKMPIRSILNQKDKNIEIYYR
jgi:6-phosphogluconolactonase